MARTVMKAEEARNPLCTFVAAAATSAATADDDDNFDDSVIIVKINVTYQSSVIAP
jgi:hypothetical protein